MNSVHVAYPPTNHAGAHCGYIHVCLGCRGELRWTELPYTPSVPLYVNEYEVTPRARSRTQKPTSEKEQKKRMQSRITQTGYPVGHLKAENQPLQPLKQTPLHVARASASLLAHPLHI